MRKFLLPFLLIASAYPWSGWAQSVTARPNIIIILTSDLGYHDVSFNGCPDFQTPNIDSLTINGIKCSNGYSTHPISDPSLAALMTGRYQQRLGFENHPEIDGLPVQELLLLQILKAGCICVIVRKWRLVVAPNLRPNQRGFDEFFGFLGSCSHWHKLG